MAFSTCLVFGLLLQLVVLVLQKEKGQETMIGGKMLE